MYERKFKDIKQLQQATKKILMNNIFFANFANDLYNLALIFFIKNNKLEDILSLKYEDEKINIIYKKSLSIIDNFIEKYIKELSIEQMVIIRKFDNSNIKISNSFIDFKDNLISKCKQKEISLNDKNKEFELFNYGNSINLEELLTFTELFDKLSPKEYAEIIFKESFIGKKLEENRLNFLKNVYNCKSNTGIYEYILSDSSSYTQFRRWTIKSFLNFKDIIIPEYKEIISNHSNMEDFLLKNININLTEYKVKDINIPSLKIGEYDKLEYDKLEQDKLEHDKIKSEQTPNAIVKVKNKRK